MFFKPPSVAGYLFSKFANVKRLRGEYEATEKGLAGSSLFSPLNTFQRMTEVFKHRL
jgi:hypothetical protein